MEQNKTAPRPGARLPHRRPPSGLSQTGNEHRPSAPEQQRSRGVILPEENGLPEHMDLNCRETEP